MLARELTDARCAQAKAGALATQRVGILLQRKTKLVLACFPVIVGLSASLTSAASAPRGVALAAPTNVLARQGTPERAGLSSARPEPEEHGLSKKAVEITRIFSLAITNSMTVSWIVALGLITLAQVATGDLKLLEWLVEGLYQFSGGNQQYRCRRPASRLKTPSGDQQWRVDAVEMASAVAGSAIVPPRGPLEVCSIMSTELPAVYLARHGETAWSLSGQHTGLPDLPLTERGQRNARSLGELLKGLTFAKVFTSPLQRARRTCELAGFGTAVEVDRDLLEWNYGQYEGRRTAKVPAERPDWQLFRDGCPGGESSDQVGARADRVVGQVRAVAGDVLLFSSGHFLRVLAARWLGLKAADGRFFLLSTASLSALGYEHNWSQPVIRLWDDTRLVGL